MNNIPEKFLKQIDSICEEKGVGYDEFMKELNIALEDRRFKNYGRAYVEGEAEIREITKELKISSKRFYKYLKRNGLQKTEYRK